MLAGFGQDFKNVPLLIGRKQENQTNFQLKEIEEARK
jgi:hypothetical protein